MEGETLRDQESHPRSEPVVSNEIGPLVREDWGIGDQKKITDLCLLLTYNKPKFIGRKVPILEESYFCYILLNN